MSTLSDFAKRVLANGLPEGMDEHENPFIKTDRGLVYLRYNRIEIQDSTDEYGGLMVRLFWSTRHVGSLRIEDAKPIHQALVLSGMEGRMLVTLTST